ncbi:MAG: hypothetical protein HY401_07920, partial [Elusimicrobia bacterium]|nr:hypothetical protein [Elusimicrobiota bacterium]
ASFPAKKIGVVIPIARSAEDIKNNADFYSKIKEKHLQNCQLPETIDLGGGELIKKPLEWV